MNDCQVFVVVACQQCTSLCYHRVWNPVMSMSVRRKTSLRLWTGTCQGWIWHCSFLLCQECSVCVDRGHSRFFCTQMCPQQFQSVRQIDQTLCPSFLERYLRCRSIQMEFDSTWIFPKACWRWEPTAFFVKSDLPITTSGVENTKLRRAADLAATGQSTLTNSVPEPWCFLYHWSWNIDDFKCYLFWLTVGGSLDIRFVGP